MEKKNFLNLLKCYLDDEFPEFKSKSIRDVDRILSTTVMAILRVISDGDDVRISPFGVFFPKLVQKDGELMSIKIGFSSFNKTNEELEQRFSKELNINIGKAKIFSAGGTYRMKDPTGDELYNLTEIARMAGISPPTAYKYAEKFKDKIDIVNNGTGKKYKESVALFFSTIRKRHSPSRARKNTQPQNCCSLSQVSRITSISMVTLYNYLRKYPTEVYPIISNDGKRWYTQEMIDNFIKIKERNIDSFGKTEKN